MSRHTRQMSIAESGKQVLFTSALADRYANYRINRTYVSTYIRAYAQERQHGVRLLLYGLLFAGMGSVRKLTVSTDSNRIE